MGNFFGKKNQAKNKDAKSAKELERLRKEGAADFERRAKAFWPEWLELRKKHGIDFGIVWDYDIVRGPRPQVVPIDAKKAVEAERQAAQGIVKPKDGGIIKGEA